MATNLPTTRAQLDNLPTWAVIRAARRFEEMLGDVLSPCGLSPIQFGALAHLSIHTSLTQAQLAERLLRKPQSANHLLDVLIDRGLIERLGERGSGRPNPIQLTPFGRKVLADAWPRVVAANTAAAIGISPRQLEELQKTTDAILSVDQPKSGPVTPRARPRT